MKKTVTISIEEKTLQRINQASGDIPRSRVIEEIINRGLTAIGDETLILQKVKVSLEGIDMSKKTEIAGASNFDRLAPHDNDTYSYNFAGRVHSV